MSKRDGTWDVHLMNADGSGLQTLTGLAARRQSCLVTRRTEDRLRSHGEIYVMNADGSDSGI